MPQSLLHGIHGTHDWGGITLYHDLKPYTREEIAAPANTVAISFKHLPETHWRADGRETSRSTLLCGHVFIYSTDSFVWGPVDKSVECILVPVSRNLLNRVAARNDVDPIVQLRPVRFEDDPKLFHLASLMRLEILSSQPSMDLYRESLLNAFVLHTICTYGGGLHRECPRSSGLSAVRLRQVLEYMRAGLAEEVSLDTLASIACLSVSHFIRSFRVATGATPHQYLLSLRMQRARELLQGSCLPVGEIARLTGFSSLSHFAARFRAQFGNAPSSVRREACLQAEMPISR